MPSTLDDWKLCSKCDKWKNDCASFGFRKSICRDCQIKGLSRVTETTSSAPTGDFAVCHQCGQSIFYGYNHVCPATFGGAYQYHPPLKAEETSNAGVSGVFKHSVRQTGGDHYENMGIQPRAIIRANNLNYFEGRALTYLLRWRVKGGVEDLQKAIDFINMEIEYQEAQKT